MVIYNSSSNERSFHLASLRVFHSTNLATVLDRMFLVLFELFFNNINHSSSVWHLVLIV